MYNLQVNWLMQKGDKLCALITVFYCINFILMLDLRDFNSMGSFHPIVLILDLRDFKLLVLWSEQRKELTI